VNNAACVAVRETSCVNWAISESYGVSRTPSLDIDLLRSFVLIAEGESFTRAAARVGRTQAAISLQVQRLEALVGRRLFLRSRGGRVQLTAQGSYLLEQAHELVALNDAIVGSLRGQSQLLTTPQPTRTVDTSHVGFPAVRQPSIAVLPFQNMTGESEQEYFAYGVVDDIIAGLTRIKSVLVIAHNSTLPYKGRAADVRQIGRELGVRYILQGGIRKAGTSARIAIQLLEAETAKHLWAGNFDGKLDDVFNFQDRVTDQVVGIVEPNVQRSEIERAYRRRPENLDAYALFLRALPHVAARMPEQVDIAVPLLEQAQIGRAHV
jgi:TolB-like protein